MQDEGVTLHEILSWLLLGMLAVTMLTVHLYVMKLDPISIRVSPPVQLTSPNGNAFVTVEVIIPRFVLNVAAKLEWADPAGVPAGSSAWTLNGENSAVTSRFTVRLDEVGQWQFAAVVWDSNGIRGRAHATALVSGGEGDR